MNLESKLGAALQALHDMVVEYAAKVGCILPPTPFVFTMGTPPGADTRKRKAGAIVADVNKLVAVFEPQADSPDKVTRIEINDRLALGSPEFYGAVLHGVASIVTGKSSRGKTETYYGDGFTDNAKRLGLRDKRVLDVNGDAFRAVCEHDIKWPLVARSAVERKRDGGDSVAFLMTLLDAKGNPIDTKAFSATVRVSKPAAEILTLSLEKGARIKLTLKTTTPVEAPVHVKAKPAKAPKPVRPAPIKAPVAVSPESTPTTAQATV